MRAAASSLFPPLLSRNRSRSLRGHRRLRRRRRSTAAVLESRLSGGGGGRSAAVAASLAVAEEALDADPRNIGRWWRWCQSFLPSFQTPPASERTTDCSPGEESEGRLIAMRKPPSSEGRAKDRGLFGTRARPNVAVVVVLLPFPMSSGGGRAGERASERASERRSRPLDQPESGTKYYYPSEEDTSRQRRSRSRRGCNRSRNLSAQIRLSGDAPLEKPFAMDG